MLKAAGALLVIGGATLFGISSVSVLGLRVRALRQLTEALNLMRSELRFTLAPIPQLLEDLGKRQAGSVGDFFQACSAGLQGLGEYSFPDIWSAALREKLGGLLKNEELLAMESLGDVLGRYDVEEQVNGVEYALQRLEQFGTVAEQDRSRLGRVYGTMSVLSGIAAVIILI